MWSVDADHISNIPVEFVHMSLSSARDSAKFSSAKSKHSAIICVRIGTNFLVPGIQVLVFVYSIARNLELEFPTLRSEDFNFEKSPAIRSYWSWCELSVSTEMLESVQIWSLSLVQNVWKVGHDAVKHILEPITHSTLVKGWTLHYIGDKVR